MQNKKPEERFQSGNVLLVSIIHLVHDIYSSFLAPLLPLLINKHGISYSSAGLLSVMQRIPSFFNPLIGLMADKHNLRYFVIISPSITSLMMSLLGLAPSYTILMILCFVMGISSAFFHVPSPVMIKEVAGSRVGKGMSFYMLGGELARSIGPLVIMAAVGLWGLEGTYRLLPFGITASIILFFRFRKVEASKSVIEPGKEKISGTIKEMTPFFISIGGIILFRSIIKGALTTYLPTYLTSKGESLWFAGGALSVIQIAGAFGTFFSGSLSDHFGRKKTLFIVTLITPVLMYFFLVLEGIPALLMLILLGVFLFSTDPVLLAYVNERKTANPAFINGTYMGINFGLSALTLLFVGFSGDNIGLEITYQLAVISGFLVLPFILCLPKK